MKITKQYLKEIIKEETARILERGLATSDIETQATMSPASQELADLKKAVSWIQTEMREGTAASFILQNGWANLLRALKRTHPEIF